MTLACPEGLYYTPHSTFAEALVWSIGLLLPVMTFLVLPRLLPLRRELRWMRIRLQAFVVRLASPRAERAALRAKMNEAFLREVHAAHPEGSRLAAVVRDASLLARARVLGFVLGGMVFVLHASLAAAIAWDGEPQSLRFALGVLLSGAAMAFLTRVAATSGAAWVQSLALGRGLATRLAAGLVVGGGYGSVAAFTTAFAGLWVLVPVMSLLTFDAPSSYQMMVALTAVGAVAGMLGSFLGALVLTPLALAARRK